MLLVNPVLQFDLPTDVILVKMFKTVLLVISVKLCVLIRSTLLPIILFTLLLWTKCRCRPLIGLSDQERLEGELFLHLRLPLILLSQLLPLDWIEVGIELFINLALVTWAAAVISRLSHLRVLGYDCFRWKSAILDFHAHLLLLSVFHALIPSCTVFMQSLEEVLHILISAALYIDLGFECALLLFLHLFKDAGGLQVDFFVAMSELLQGLIMLGPFRRRFFGGMRICRPRR